MCNIDEESHIPAWLPQHRHISDHQGYNLQRPAEFFRKYGHYTLSILTLISGEIVQPYDTSRLLWSHAALDKSSGLSEKNIKSYIDKAIDHILAVVPPLPWKSKVVLDSIDTHDIHEYLDVKDGDNSVGNLYRHSSSVSSTHWLCQSHVQPLVDTQALNSLQDFVRNLTGHLDMHHGTIQIHLKTLRQGSRFFSLLKDTKRLFDVSIKLGWTISRLHMHDLRLLVAKAGVSILQIDGVTPDVHPQNCIEHNGDLIVNMFKNSTNNGSNGVQVLTLLNYPGHNEQYSYLAHTHYFIYGLQCTQPSRPPSIGWHTFRQNLYTFENAVRRKVFATNEGSLRIARDLRALLTESKLSHITAIDFYNRQLWRSTFDVKDGVFRDVQLHPAREAREDGFTEAQMREVLSAFSLTNARRLTVDVRDTVFDSELDQFVHSNRNIQELCLLAREPEVFTLVRDFVQRWRRRASRLNLTLYDRSSSGQGRVLVRATIGGNRCRHVKTKSGVQQADRPVKFDTLEQGCVYISRPLTITTALVLESAMSQHPQFLSSFTLDISHLSSTGLVHVRSILQHSALEHLHVRCTHFSPSMEENVFQVLESVQWPTIKSLVFSGDHIDDWIKLWAWDTPHLLAHGSMGGPRLLQLGVVGPGGTETLSHASALFLHQLVYSSVLVELHLEGIGWERSDLDLVLEAVGDVSWSLGHFIAVHIDQN